LAPPLTHPVDRQKTVVISDSGSKMSPAGLSAVHVGTSRRLESLMLRKPFATAAILVLTVASGASAQMTPARPDAAAEQAKLEADSLIWFDYFAKADGDAMAKLYAEDALLMPPGAPAVKGRAGIRTFLGEDAARTKAAGLALKSGAVTGSGVDGDTGWISGTYTVVDASGKTVDSGSYLSVHRRIGGAWLYIRDIWNSDRPPAAAPSASKAPGAR
jgi:ketosteroid isomerase-like protein